MNEILGISADILAPSALVGLFVLAILTGRLVPRRTYDDKVHECNEWRAESRIKDQQLLEVTEQNTKMLNAFGPTLTAFLRELRHTANIQANNDNGGDTS